MLYYVGFRSTIGWQSFGNILAEIVVGYSVEMHQHAETIEWRTFSLENFGHHRLLAAQKNVVNVLLRLDNGSQSLVDALV